MTAKPADGTAALDKALDVLDAVGRAPGGALSQNELAARLGLPRTTLYRLLGSLVARGMLRRDPLRRVWCIGQRCFEYARAAYAMPDLVAAAGSELRALRDMTGETTYVAALDGHEVVTLERCDGAHDERSRTAVGARKPLHCTSQGKAILAALPAAQRDELVRAIPLPALTPHTITDRRRLQAELRRTAERGWSLDEEEIVPGVRCCGAAIVDAQGSVRGAISVAGPAFRLSAERVRLLGPEVAAAAERIGAQLAAGVSALPAPASDVRALPGSWAFDGAWPFWHAGEGVLYWADTLAPAIHRADDAGDEIVARLDAPVQALLPHAGAAAAVQVGDAWFTLDAGGALRPLAWPQRRLSAACAAPDGTPWGCWAEGERWRVAPLAGNGAAGWLLGEPVTALAWSPDAQRLYIAKAGSGALHLAAAGTSALRRLADVPAGAGRLAALAADVQGGVWAALRGGWSVMRFAADGSTQRVLAVPVPCPTGVALGGARGERLYITSARDAVGRDALDAAPLSGRLFVASI
jgi:IclR family acetate operon transcriptional repressor